MAYNWRESFLEEISERDSYEQRNSGLFRSFETLYERLRLSEEKLSKIELTEVQKELETAFTDNESLKKQIQYQKSKIYDLKELELASREKCNKSLSQVADLNKVVTKLTNKLNNQTEEYHHKNKSIELLNDEFLSLQIQNNLLFSKVDKLEKENEGLVKRWMEKVKSDADKLNETNAFIEQFGSSSG